MLNSQCKMFDSFLVLKRLYTMITIKVYYITRVQLHVITRITSSCIVLLLDSMLRFCCDKTLFEENSIEENLNFKILNIHIFTWSTEPHILAIIFIYKIYCKIILLLKFEDFPLPLQRKIKSRNTAVNTIEKAYENIKKLMQKILLLQKLKSLRNFVV